MAGIEEIVNKQQQWQARQPVINPHNLFMKQGDLMFGWFIATGEPNDPYFEVFSVHEQASQNPKEFAKQYLCPIDSAFDMNFPCSFCKDGQRTKRRMAMWFYVVAILHANPPQPRQNQNNQPAEQLPQVQYNNRIYWQRVINGPKFWNTSAWKDSPLDDIIFMGQQQGNLRANQIQLACLGEGIERRYKLWTMQGAGPIDPGILQKCISEIKPVRTLLMETMLPVQVASNPGASVSTFQPTGAVTGSSNGGGGGGGAFVPVQPAAQQQAQPAVAQFAPAPTAVAVSELPVPGEIPFTSAFPTAQTVDEAFPTPHPVEDSNTAPTPEPAPAPSPQAEAVVSDPRVAPKTLFGS